MKLIEPEEMEDFHGVLARFNLSAEDFDLVEPTPRTRRATKYSDSPDSSRSRENPPASKTSIRSGTARLGWRNFRETSWGKYSIDRASSRMD